MSLTVRTTSNRDVFLYIPNLIGYSRVLFSLLSFVLMIFAPQHQNQWSTAIILYIASFTLDLFDGMAARKFNQCSDFGGLLDMITDRCSTLGLLFILYGEYGYSGNYYQLYHRLVSLFVCLFCMVVQSSDFRFIHSFFIINNSKCSWKNVSRD